MLAHRPHASRAEAANRVAIASTWALQNLGEDLSIERLAAAAHLSRWDIREDLPRLDGDDSRRMVSSRRLDEAQRLLETSELSVDQIAASCGFGNPVTLRQNFAIAFGSTPSSYRRRVDARP